MHIDIQQQQEHQQQQQQQQQLQQQKQPIGAYQCGDLQLCVGRRQCYLTRREPLQGRRCYFACRVSSRFVN